MVSSSSLTSETTRRVRRLEMLCRDLEQIERRGSKDQTLMTPQITTCKETNKKKRRLEGRENKRKNTRNLTRPRSDEVVYVVEEEGG